jgi:hypothetical protein
MERADPSDALTLYCLRQITPGALDAASDLALWRWIEQNCAELRVDDLARREVRSRIAAASESLQEALEPFGRPSAGTEEAWIYRGKTLDVLGRGQLNRKLSDICDEVFDGPILRNELINRSRLSSAAASARMRLLEAMVENADRPFLGFEGAPPERTVYLSLFLSSNVHRLEKGHWVFGVPDPDLSNWGPTWKRIETFLREHGSSSFDAIAADLAKPPIGLRAGPALPMIAAFMLHHKREVALFERNTFQPEVTGAHFMRLAKNPANFSLKYLGRSPSTEMVLVRLSAGLAIWPEQGRPEASLKSIVEAMYRWWYAVPAYSKETGTISKSAQAVRSAFKKADEPIRFVYSQLPQACGLPQLDPDACDSSQADILVEMLNIHLLDINDAASHLRSQARAAVLEAFGARTLEKLRVQIASDYGRHALRLTDYRLRAFVDRASDRDMNDGAWLDGVASLLAGKRIEAWKDDTIEIFLFETRAIAARLARWLAHIKLIDASASPMVSIHVVDTTGQEKMVVVRKGALTKDVAAKVVQIKKMLAGARDPVLVLAHVMAELTPHDEKEKSGG